MRVTVCEALGNLVFVDDLAIHNSEEVFLLGQEGLGRSSVEAALRTFTLTDLLEMCADSLLQHFESVFSVLRIQLGQVGNRADGGEDSVISGEDRFWAEGCDHGDAFGGTKSSQGSVLNIATLEDDGVTLCMRADGWA